MVQILLKSAGVIFYRLLGTLASEALLEWAFFKLADALVKSTKTKHDDEWLERIKAEYEKVNKSNT